MNGSCPSVARLCALCAGLSWSAWPASAGAVENDGDAPARAGAAQMEEAVLELSYFRTNPVPGFVTPESLGYDLAGGEWQSRVDVGVGGFQLPAADAAVRCGPEDLLTMAEPSRWEGRTPDWDGRRFRIVPMGPAPGEQDGANPEASPALVLLAGVAMVGLAGSGVLYQAFR